MNETCTISRLRASLISVLVSLACTAALALAQAGVPGGSIVLPYGADLLIVDAVSGQERELILDGDALISSVAWAPNRDRLAVARSSRPPGDMAFGQDIEILDAADGKVLSAVRRDTSGIILDFPVWTRDGQSLLYDRQETVRFGVEWRIERSNLDGSERSVLVPSARSPSLSPDGKQLAFVRADQGEVLHVSAADGQGARPVTPPGSFLLINHPRFSPDGQWIAFATVTDPTRETTPDRRERSGEMRVLGLIQPALLAPRRHGIPWDIWLVRPDGSELHLVRSAEDDPSLAWAPDGSGIALYGGRGLGFMDSAGEVQPLRQELIGFGGIDWAR